MVKKIKKNSSYSYDDRNIKAKGNSIDEQQKIEDIIPDIDAQDAGYVQRALAYALDLLTYVPFAVLLQITSSRLRIIGGAENERSAMYMSISIICLALLLFGYLPAKWKGQTLGKKLFKIRVVPTEPKKIEFFKYILREFVGKISFGMIIVPAVLIYWLYQTVVKKEVKPVFLHDKIMDTRVVKVTKK